MPAAPNRARTASLKVDYQSDASGFTAKIELPEGVEAEVSLPVNRGETSVQVDGSPVAGVASEDGTRLIVPLSTPGPHELRSRESLP